MESPGAPILHWISYVFPYILPPQIGPSLECGESGCAYIRLDFLCISIHSTSPEWVCSRCSQNAVSPICIAFPVYFHTFYLSKVGLREPFGKSALGDFLCISCVFPYLLPLQGESAGPLENRPSVNSHGIPLYFHTSYLSNVGLREPLEK